MLWWRAHGAAWPRATRHDTTWNDATRYDATRYDATRNNAAKHIVPRDHASRHDASWHAVPWDVFTLYDAYRSHSIDELAKGITSGASHCGHAGFSSPRSG